MKSILLIGLGRFGKYVAKKLNDLNHQVMAVDTDEDRVNAILPFVTNAQIGDSTNQEFMESLGVDNYDVCIVAIGDNFQSSLETAFLLKELGAKKVIARASKGTQEKILLRNGADQVVYPEKQLAAWCAITCTSDSIMDYIALNKEFAIFEMAVPSEWYGRSVIEIDIRKDGCLFISEPAPERHTFVVFQVVRIITQVKDRTGLLTVAPVVEGKHALGRRAVFGQEGGCMPLVVLDHDLRGMRSVGKRKHRIVLIRPSVSRPVDIEEE